MDMTELFRRHAGGIIGVGEFGADVKMDDLAALLGKLREEVEELLHTRGRSLGQCTVLLIAGIHIERGKVAAVQKSILAEGDGQRDHRNVIAVQKLLREVAGAVGSNNNRLCQSGFLLHAARIAKQRDYSMTAPFCLLPNDKQLSETACFFDGNRR